MDPDGRSTGSVSAGQSQPKQQLPKTFWNIMSLPEAVKLNPPFFEDRTVLNDGSDVFSIFKQHVMVFLEEL